MDSDRNCRTKKNLILSTFRGKHWLRAWKERRQFLNIYIKWQWGKCSGNIFCSSSHSQGQRGLMSHDNNGLEDDEVLKYKLVLEEPHFHKINVAWGWERKWVPSIAVVLIAVWRGAHSADQYLFIKKKRAVKFILCFSTMKTLDTCKDHIN